MNTAPEKSNQKHPLVLLDVYDTLLKMDSVEKRVNQLLESRHGYQIWFELFMQYCFVDNCIEEFNDFTAIAVATLQMSADKLHTSISKNEIQLVLELLKQLPLQEDVAEGLSLLNDQGKRIAALTNSPEITVRERMERTGLISYFEKVLSAEHVGKYKPDLSVYQWAAKTLGVLPSDILLVSSHGWDLAGARNAGMQTAYLKQGDQLLYPLAPKPDYTCTSLLDLAKIIQ